MRIFFKSQLLVFLVIMSIDCSFLFASYNHQLKSFCSLSSFLSLLTILVQTSSFPFHINSYNSLTLFSLDLTTLSIFFKFFPIFNFFVIIIPLLFLIFRSIQILCLLTFWVHFQSQPISFKFYSKFLYGSKILLDWFIHIWIS